MKKIFVILGVQGSGKGTQAQKLLEEYDFNYIETGAIFRGLNRDNPMDAEIMSVIESGNLVSDEQVCALIESRITTDKHIITDGFPRTEPQAQWLVKWASKNGYGIYTLLLDIPREMAISRIQKRVSQGAGRKDDSDPAAVSRRLDQYYAKTRPMVDFLKSANGAKFFEIDGTGTEDEVFAEVMKIAKPIME